MADERNRRIHSLKEELLSKSQEAALAAIQVFNNPLITFKSETFIVLMNIAWTYLFHAYYREKKVEYKYYKKGNKRKKFETTPRGAHKHWELEKCLNAPECPLEQPIKDNLLFLINIRHEIEHQMTSKIDEFISAKFQACCINYNNTIKSLFGKHKGLDKKISVALQLFGFGEDQITQLKSFQDVPKNIIEFVSDFEAGISTKDDPKYSYRVIYVRTNVNHPNQADIAYKFIDENSAEGKEIQNVLIKKVSRKKITEKDIVAFMRESGFLRFNSNAHQKFWKTKWCDAKTRNSSEDAKNFGEVVMKDMWLWYEDSWLPEVKRYCERNKHSFSSQTNV